MHPGFIGAIIGVTVGIIGGLIGSYYSIKNTKGPLEKTFIKKVILVFWIFGIIYLLLLITIPIPYNFLFMTCSFIIFPFFIRYINNKLKKIQMIEKLNYKN
ncbi:MAG: hypothetical protein Kow0019_17850 [Methanobacteriaceae archaeon]